MAYISKIKLPNNSEYDVKDSSKGGVYFVSGTQDTITGTWTGVLNEVDELFDGLTIAYYLPCASSGNVTLNLTLSNGDTGAIECYYTGTTRLSTQYEPGSIILLTYISAGKNAKTSSNPSAIIATNRWVGADYTIPTSSLDLSYDETNEDLSITWTAGGA